MARIVIVGAGGRLGAALAREYSDAERDVIAFNRAQLDLSEAEQMRQKLGALEFDVLINCAGMTNVDDCERHPAEALRLNGEAPGVLAQICAEKNARLIHFSTDYVFDGTQTRPYDETDVPKPASIYGESKLDGEKRVLAVSDDNLVIRVSWVFGPDRPSFVDWIIKQAREHDTVSAVADKFSTPSYTLDLADLLLPLFDKEIAGGVIHLANTGECSWREYGQWGLECCQAEGVSLRAREVMAISLAEMKNFIARRPPYTVLSTAKYEELTHRTPRDWHDAVADYVKRFYANT